MQSRKQIRSNAYLLANYLALFVCIILNSLFAAVIETLGIHVSPYIVLLILPSLGRMSDQNKAIRTMATYCFGSLIRLMPLEVRLHFSGNHFPSVDSAIYRSVFMLIE